MKLNDLKKEIKTLANEEKAKILQGFFKTGSGEYGEGMIFLGVAVPQIRKISQQFYDLSLADLNKLLLSNLNEFQSASLYILVNQYKKGDEQKKKEIYSYYIKNAKNMNSWGLVDVSAPHIVGNYLLDKSRDVLYKLAKSNNLWKKRIAIISTFSFIRQNQFKDTLKISEILMNDEHDLIHKAVGWMLREVGKKDQKTEESFLKKYYKKMPRTMLRYAIEKFEETKRKKYLYGEI